MMKLLRKGLSFLVVLTMLVAMLPTTVFAAVDSTGKPTDLKNKLILSIYTPTGEFPGEPAIYSTSNYKSFNSDFTVGSPSFLSNSVTFKSSAESELDPKILDVLVEGAHSSSTTVWGAYDANGMKDYFLKDASIIKEENEIKMICAIKGVSEAEAKNYEIVWYVIKLQHNSGWLGSTEWHIDGVIKEKSKVSINYYGNGNTSGNAPKGETNHTSGAEYVVQSENDMTKIIHGVEVDFLGWSAKSDGTGEEKGFYQPGEKIYPTENISLYAMWDTTTQHTATVNTFLDGVPTSDSAIHEENRELYLSTDEIHYYKLEEIKTGVYEVKITGNGKFHLYYKEADGDYQQFGAFQLTLYNGNGSLDVHHFSVSYDTNGGTFANAPHSHGYLYGEAVNATTEVPTREGYKFLGWEKSNGELVAPGGVVTDYITEKTVLTAKWEKNVSVTINVTINHEGGGGYDRATSKDDVTIELVSREDSSKPYLETGHVLNLNNTSYNGYTYTPTYGKDTSAAEVKKTQYTAKSATYTDLPGGSAEYTVVASKSGYDTEITSTKDANGNWIVNVAMTYNPMDFDLEFTVTVDEDVPARYVPTGAIVKIACWNAEEKEWQIISQQDEGAPGVHVTIDPSTRKGSGSYPVWKHEPESEVPYGYRLVVSSFIYPDGTIVKASDLVKDVSWTDGAYIATMDEVSGGQKYGDLYGAYVAKDSDTQLGKLNANITLDLFNVVFDAKGGKVNGLDKQTVTEQLRIPAFADYVPTRDGGYIFDGWYLDEAYKTPAVEGEALSDNITLYAKWIAPLTISGTVSVSGTYTLDGKKVSVNETDRAVEAGVILQELHNDHTHDVDSEIVTFGTYGDLGSANYAFTGIPNDGKSYQIQVVLLNYTTTYDNESDNGTSYSDNEYAAVFGGDNVADVDAYLAFTAPSYTLSLNVDAVAIGSDFRPSEVISEIMYRDVGSSNPYTRISQHNVAPYGVEIGLNNGVGSENYSVWQWHTNGQLYRYQMNVTVVDGKAYNSDTAPFSIKYDPSAYWNEETGAASGALKATLVPKIYKVSFDLNGEGDEVTGMDAYLQEDGTYFMQHTWSYDTPFNTTPERENYTFLGWEADVDGAYDGSKIGAEVGNNVTLTAKWEKIKYTVATSASPAEGGTTSGDGTYDIESEATVEAVANTGYEFAGWYENDAKVSDDAKYTFTVAGNRTLVAKFEKVIYTVATSANPAEGGTTSGDGSYAFESEATVEAVANTGYEFAGWYENDAKVSDDAKYTFTVTGNRTLVAKFEKVIYTVATSANPAEGGTTSGDGSYAYGASATVTAVANAGYEFAGWFENDAKVSDDAEYTFTVTGNRTLVAKFEKITYTVETSASPAEGGTTSGDGTYADGASATVTAVANTGYEFAGWYENDAKVSDDAEYSFTVKGNRNLVAKFEKIIYTYAVKTSASPAEGGTTSGDGTYADGASATVTAVANAGYEFAGWYENDAKVYDDAKYTFTVEGNRTLVAKFEKEVIDVPTTETYTVTTVVQGNGTASGAGTYEKGTVVTLTAEADSGNVFIGWRGDDGELITSDKSFKHTVTADVTFVAYFERASDYSNDYAYIFGYNDKEMGAEGPLLRSEVSVMVHRLVKQNKKLGNFRYNASNPSFADIAGEWFQSGIEFMHHKGAFKVAEGGNVQPYVAVTRGETFKIIALGLGFTEDTTLSNDQYANLLFELGYIQGDDSGDLNVGGTITRAEFCTMYNRIIGRENALLIDADGNEITAETYGFTDLESGKWYYKAMLRATSAYDADGFVDIAKRGIRNDLDDYGN